MPQQLLLVARLHDGRDARDEVGRLLPDLGRLVVEAPLDRAAHLRARREGGTELTSVGYPACWARWCWRIDMPGVSALAHARGQAHTSLRGGRVGGVPCWSHVLPPEAVPCQCRFSMRAHKWLGLLRAGCRVPVGGECCWVHFSSFLSML